MIVSLALQALQVASTRTGADMQTGEGLGEPKSTTDGEEGERTPTEENVRTDKPPIDDELPGNAKPDLNMPVDRKKHLQNLAGSLPPVAGGLRAMSEVLKNRVGATTRARQILFRRQTAASTPVLRKTSRTSQRRTQMANRCWWSTS